MNGGTLTLADTASVGITLGATVEAGTLAVDSGTLTAGSLSVTGAGTFSEVGGNATISAQAEFGTGGTGTIGGGTLQVGTLTVDGGVLTLSGGAATTAPRTSRRAARCR